MHEIARLIADSVIAQARDFATAKSDERVARKQSDDWFDRLVVERERRNRIAELTKKRQNRMAKQAARQKD